MNMADEIRRSANEDAEYTLRGSTDEWADHIDKIEKELEAATATLNRLKKVIPVDLNGRGYGTADVLRVWRILYGRTG